MSTSILARYWFPETTRVEIAARFPSWLRSAGFQPVDAAEGGSPGSSGEIHLADEGSSSWAEMSHAAAGIDAFVTVGEVRATQGPHAVHVTLKANSASFGSPLEKGYYPARAVLFEAAALALYEVSSARYGYLTAADFEAASKLRWPAARYEESFAFEWSAIVQNTLLSLHPVNFLPAAILERYPKIESIEPDLVRRVRLRDDGLMLALSRCFIWNERVVRDQFAQELGISQAWQGGSWQASSAG